MIIQNFTCAFPLRFNTPDISCIHKSHPNTSSNVEKSTVFSDFFLCLFRIISFNKNHFGGWGLLVAEMGGGKAINTGVMNILKFLSNG